MPTWLEVSAKYTDDHGNILETPSGIPSYAVRKVRVHARPSDDAARTLPTRVKLALDYVPPL